MPILFRHTAPLFAVWHITEDAESLFTALYNKETYRPQLDALRTDTRRTEWLACRVLLQTLLEREVTVDYLPNGAPTLRDLPFSVSLSHTKGYAAALVTPHAHAGIDIEYRSDRVKKIRSRFRPREENPQPLYARRRRYRHRPGTRERSSAHLLVRQRSPLQAIGRGGGRLPGTSPYLPLSLFQTRNTLRARAQNPP